MLYQTYINYDIMNRGSLYAFAIKNRINIRAIYFLHIF